MRGIFTACLVSMATACTPGTKPPDEAARFDAWHRAGNAHAVAAYTAFLRRHEVDGVLSLPELLRSGRHWKRCRMSEFVVPPADAWPRIVPTLRVVRALQRERLLAGARAVSVFRGPALNRCEGGSRGSRHLIHNAIDFDLTEGADIGELCRYWREHGKEMRFGLGFYDARRIHVDTSGFRTWGLDYTFRTSRCQPTR